MASRTERGKKAEDLACAFLKKRGMKIIARNQHEKGGEIDIVARDRDEICLVEVRSRHSADSPFLPEESVNYHKQRHLTRSARRFIHEHKLDKVRIRFDLLVVDWQTGDPEIRFYPGGIAPLENRF